MTASSLTNAYRIKVCTLKEYIGGTLWDTWVLATKHTCNTHWLFGIANHEVSCRQSTLYSIESYELLSFGSIFNHHFSSFDFIRIKWVQSLSHLMEHKVGNVHHVVDRTDTNGRKCFLQPIRWLLDSHALDAHTRITRTSLCILYNHLNWQIIAIHFKRLYRRFGKSNILTMCLIIRIQVTRNTIVASTIRTVRSNIYLNERIILYTKILFSRHTHRSIRWQDHDAIMARTHTYLVFCTDHTQWLFATDLAFLDSKFLLAIIEDSTHRSHNDLLTRSHIRCTTYDLQGFCIGSNTSSSDMQVVRIRVIYTSDNLTYDQTLKTTFDGLNFFYFTYF